MARKYEFELDFEVPEEASKDRFDLADAVYEAGFDDVAIGLGVPGLIAVPLEHEGVTARSALLDAARRILKHLPKGSKLRSAGPDLVTLADVADRLEVRRQALQKKRMPPPVTCGLFRASEIAQVLRAETRGKIALNMRLATNWLDAAPAAQIINAELALGRDPLRANRRQTA